MSLYRTHRTHSDDTQTAFPITAKLTQKHTPVASDRLRSTVDAREPQSALTLIADNLQGESVRY